VKIRGSTQGERGKEKGKNSAKGIQQNSTSLVSEMSRLREALGSKWTGVGSRKKENRGDFGGLGSIKKRDI